MRFLSISMLTFLLRLRIRNVSIFPMNSHEFKRWLAQQGATFEQGKGTVEAIKKQLRLK